MNQPEKLQLSLAPDIENMLSNTPLFTENKGRYFSETSASLFWLFVLCWTIESEVIMTFSTLGLDFI